MLNLVYFQPDFGMSIQSPPKVSARPVGLIDIEESRTSGVGETSNGKAKYQVMFLNFCVCYFLFQQQNLTRIVFRKLELYCCRHLAIWYNSEL